MKLFQVVLPLLFLAAQCFADPASPVTFPLKQPDGTIIEVRQEGNEWFHILETSDGYILQKDVLGFYAYADENGNSSGIYARNARERSEADKQFLSGVNQNLVYKNLKASTAIEQPEYDVPKLAKSTVQKAAEGSEPREVRVLVVLVQFSDVKFSNPDPQSQFTDFFNKEGYSENYNAGSVRDYFIKNSAGQFRPTFDVYGPVTVSGSRYDYGTKNRSDRNPDGAMNALSEALDILKSQNAVDFSAYVEKGHTGIEYICMIYAGVSSNGSGVNEAIWSHMNSLRDKDLGGVKAYRYACTNEISSTAYSRNNSTTLLEGVGVIIHEFSHAMGLPDLYVTQGRNKRRTPGIWDVMDIGAHNGLPNYEGHQAGDPPLYASHERMRLGWLTPTELGEGSVRLDKLDDNVAYRVSHASKWNEYYLMEYRTVKGWDGYLPNSGMLIWHIDYDKYYWDTYSVNNEANHMRVDLVESVPETYDAERDYYEVDMYGTSFPGRSNVTEFNKFVFWDGSNKNVALTDITEFKEQEYVTFNVCMNSASCMTLEPSSSSVESASSEFSSSSESLSSFEESSSSEDRSSSSSNANLVERCVAFFGNVTGVGDYCYKSGLDNMREGVCYVLNPDHPRNFMFDYLSTNASDGSWWFETPCYEEVSSSSVESSSSEESSSSIDEFSSSIEPESSSSELPVSSSDEQSSSSAESSSSEESSSSIEESSSSIEPESSSSELPVSSSDEQSSSSAESSSSEVSSSSIEESSSSIEPESSSSEFIESSSSGGLVSIAFKNPSLGVRVSLQNGVLDVYAPQQGSKVVRIFSPIGSLLLERTMENAEQAFDLRSIGRSNVIISVTQGNKPLFKGIARLER